MRILYINLTQAWAYSLIILFFGQFATAQNDICGSASVLAFNTSSCVTAPFTLENSSTWTNSPLSEAPAPCAGTSQFDGWFKFTTGASTTQIDINAAVTFSTTRQIGIILYSGSCNSFTQVGCDMPNAIVANLTSVPVSPNTTYHLRIMRTNTANLSTNTSGTICVYQTGALAFNDNCVSAQSATVNSGSSCMTSTSGTTVPATASAVAVCAGTADDDVWYSFIATATSHIITVTPGTMSDAVFQMFSGTCGSLVSSGCVDSTLGSSPEVGIASALTVGNTYFIRVHSYGNATGQGTFTLCVTTNSPGTYCSSTSGSSAYYINNFSTTGGLTNITNNGSGLTPGGYANFTTISASQFAGLSVTFSAAFVGGTFGYNIWVDWNNDSDFNDSGETVYVSGGYVWNASGSFTVPTGTPVGNYRMRTRADYYNTNPSACGAISSGETEDYTFSVSPLICNTLPTAITATSATTTATINWTAPASPPASGYNYYYSTSSTAPTFASVGSGATAAGVITASLTGLTASTTYYVWVRSNCGSGNRGYWVGPITFTTGMAVTGVSICQGGSGNLSATGTCNGVGNISSISGSWNASTNPIALQPLILIANSTTCAFDTETANYTTFNFTVSVSGNYTFSMTPNANYDGMGYIVVNGFTPGVCGSGTWIVGDDDSGSASLEPMMTAALSTGITYTLVSTVFGFVNTTVTDSFIWNITSGSGGFVQGPATGSIQWYTASTGGTPIGTGSSFNPVGVAGSGLANTNTAGTTTYYVACSGNPTVRTPVNYVINSGPTSTLSGTGSICSSNTTLNIVLTGTAPWNLTYANNIGDPPVTVTGILTSPHTIAVNPAITATYTITALSSSGCLLGVNSGTASFVATVWTGAGSSWSNPTNWSTGAVPTNADCVVIPTAPNFATITASDIGEAQFLIIRNGGRLDVLNSRTITVSNRVTVDPGGIFNIESGSGLVQLDNVANVGDINLRRTISVKLYDYTYWNSPVEYNPMDVTPYTLGMLGAGAPSDKYHSWIPSTGPGTGNGIWLQELPATPMNPEKGYIIRAPLGTSPTVSFLHTMTFTGVPNNGDLTAPVSAGIAPGDNDLWNLIGNPYPSAISVASFLQNTNNDTLLDNTLYFWTHNSSPNTSYANPFYGTFYSNYSDSDYASCTAFACVKACLTCDLPNGNIGAGQSFFIKSEGLSGAAEFNNLMRTTNNSQFFRNTEAIASQSQPYSDEAEKHLIWLNMTNTSNNAFNQILVGYTQGATNAYDSNLDGERWSVSNMVFYSVIPEKNLVIQARPLPFDENDQVPLGYKVDSSGSYTIAIDKIDPMFNDYNIYLEDLEVGLIHDLKASPYLFATTAGTFNGRFVLRYTSQALSVNNFEVNSVAAFITDNLLHIRTSELLENVQVFDIGGKLIKTYLPQSDHLTNIWNFAYAQGTYLAKIKLKDGTVYTRKLIN